MRRFVFRFFVVASLLFSACALYALTLIHPEWFDRVLHLFSPVRAEVGNQYCYSLPKNFQEVCECCNRFGLTGGIGDPLTVLRLTVIPIFVWIMKSLVSYSFLRRHVVRAIYVDIEYRMRFIELCLKSGREWIESYEPHLSRVPLLRIGREEHHMYADMQADLRECAWGEEVTSVRLMYRTFDEVERLADRIRSTYNQLLEDSRRASLKEKRDAVLERRRRFRDQIAAEIARIDENYQFWLKVGEETKRRMPSEEKPKDKERPFIWVVRGVLYTKAAWHHYYVYAPCVFLLFSGLFLLGWHEPILRWLFGTAMALSLAYGAYLHFNVAEKEENRIFNIVIKEYRGRLERALNENRPPIMI